MIEELKCNENILQSKIVSLEQTKSVLDSKLMVEEEKKEKTGLKNQMMMSLKVQL